MEQKINNLETIVLEQNSVSNPTSARDHGAGADDISQRDIMSKLVKIETKLGKMSHRRRNNRRWVLRDRMFGYISGVRWQKEHLIRDFTRQYKNQYSIQKKRIFANFYAPLLNSTILLNQRFGVLYQFIFRNPSFQVLFWDPYTAFHFQPSVKDNFSLFFAWRRLGGATPDSCQQNLSLLKKLEGKVSKLS